jgi:autotransporter-associated beta strand protein
MFAELLGLPSGELGPAVISRIGSKPEITMKTLILAAIRCWLLFFVPTITYAISAQWDLDPISGDWNTAANWTPMTVPNAPADTATFGLSHTTDVSISANTEVNAMIFTSAATNPYTITASPGLTLTTSGVGITNNSGITQNVHIAIDASFNTGTLAFSNSATAGSNVSIVNDNGGTINFFNGSTAGSATIRNFADPTLTVFPTTSFFNHSTAGSAFIEQENVSTLRFANNSSAGNSTIVTLFTVDEVFGPNVQFLDNSTAGSASIFVGAGTSLQFANNSTAASASIFVNNGSISFEGSSRGGTAQIESNASTILDIRGHNAPGVSIGSIDGGIYFVRLGANNLTVGSNNLSTFFDGFIEGAGGLTKIGTGTLTLTFGSDQLYTGDTNVNGGVLQVDSSINSNTFVNHGGTLAGSADFLGRGGTINGNVTNGGKVSPGSAGAPGVLTIVHNYTQAEFATLMIQIAGASAGQFSVLDVLGTANLSGFLDPVLLNGFTPTIGQSFTFLNYAAVNGTLSIFNPNIDNLPEHWVLSFQPTFATLTVAPGNVSVPDQGSTFLLLALGLLGLVTCRQQLLRKQS